VLSTLLAPIVRVLQINKSEYAPQFLRYAYIFNIIIVPLTNLYSKSKQEIKRGNRRYLGGVRKILLKRCDTRIIWQYVNRVYLAQCNI
jgi:hypothetical protein